jgi:quinol-cytochrome oxidoreductase complex cytochrome b subunit
MDSILHYTDPTMTSVALVSFVVTFIIGTWLGAKYGKRTIFPALVISAIAFYVRSTAFPLSIEAIAAVSALHIGAGALTVLIVKQFNKS